MARTDSPDQPDLFHEHAAQADGARLVAGIDEAGRGPLAGPVVAAAVILDPDNIPSGLNDSKKLTEARREALFETIMGTALVGFCAAPVEIIDRLNILGATMWAMCGALDALPVKPDLALIDGNRVPPGLSCPGQHVIGGDGGCVDRGGSIVAARATMCEGDGLPLSPRFAHTRGYGTAPISRRWPLGPPNCTGWFRASHGGS